MTIGAGQALLHYRVVEKIGAGGMGEVYRAEDTRLGRHVAIKLLPAELRRDPQRLARLEREARLLASLNHPYVATLHGLEESGDGTRFLVMELLRQHRADRGALMAGSWRSRARQAGGGGPVSLVPDLIGAAPDRSSRSC